MQSTQTQTQETFENTAKTVKEAWNRPEFEVIGVENTQNTGGPGSDGSFTGPNPS